MVLADSALAAVPPSAYALARLVTTTESMPL
jgi:hypothetical protein